MKSILQKDNGICFLCAYLHGDTHEQFTHCHHAVAGTANRKLSERFGLKYYLCPMHHEFGTEAVHRNKELYILLIKAAELVFIKKYSFEEWMRIFQKNFLEPEELDIKGRNTAIEALYRLEELHGQWEHSEDKEQGFEATPDPIEEELPF